MNGKVEPLSVEGLRLRADIRRDIRSADDRIADQLEWAADKIINLESECAALREALRKISELDGASDCGPDDAANIARAALNAQGER